MPALRFPGFQTALLNDSYAAFFARTRSYKSRGKLSFSFEHNKNPAEELLGLHLRTLFDIELTAWLWGDGSLSIVARSTARKSSGQIIVELRLRATSRSPRLIEQRFRESLSGLSPPRKAAWIVREKLEAIWTRA